ncbi:MAG: DPP IV N-terminal domain-containing protein [Pirellulaceae bacterium]
MKSMNQVGTQKLIVSILSLIVLVLTSAQGNAQSDIRLEQLPGYAGYQEAMKNRQRPQRLGNVVWTNDGKAVNFKVGDKEMGLDLTSFQFGAPQPNPSVTPDVAKPATAAPRQPTKTPVPRAEQRPIEPSPDGKWNAVYRNNNIVLEPTPEGSGEKVPVTTTGADRLRYGTGCWVYGEELDQNEAMWWSPDSKKLVFYEVDEQGLKDYHLTVDNFALYTSLHTTRYPKAGEDNPQVNLMVYDLETKQTKRLEISGEPRQYLFNIKFAPGGKELLVNRTNRRQDVLDVLAIDLASGKNRVVVTEKQKTWQTNAPKMIFLRDGQRFIWETEANGWRNFQLRHIDGRMLNTLTKADGFPCENIVKIDESNGWLYYSAFSDQIPYNEQLHRVKLDGTEDTRITTSPLHHSNFEFDPQGRFVIATRQQVDVAPTSAMYSVTGKEVVVFPGNNDKETKINSELFSFTASDGKTKLYGTLQKPSNFDPQKKYPLLIDVYGGPNSRGMSNNFSPNHPICELGFLVAKIANRGTVGRGKEFESATYLQLGLPDLDDQAGGVKFLSQRPYVDASRIGIYGHSYGGYMSALAMLRYPDVFHVAVAGAPVTDWKNYDSIYTERYMRTPKENPDGYKIGSCFEYTKNLTGKLLIVHGLIDDNVHPSNTWQLVKALHDANKRFDLMIYPEFKHGIRSTYEALKIEYLYRHLIANYNGS